MREQRPSPLKRYVKVRADHLLDGRIRPLMYREEDGPIVVIDRIIDERQAPALRAGGQGMRYIFRVADGYVLLFHDEPLWFVEL